MRMGKRDILNHFFIFEVLLPIYQNQNNTFTSQILSKWYHNGVEDITVLDDNSSRTAYKARFFLIFFISKPQAQILPRYLRRDKVFELPHTIYQQYLAPCEFLSFLSHRKLFQAGSFNVNVRPDYSKTYQNITYGR